MKRLLWCALLVGCGPSVAVEDEDGIGETSSTDASASMTSPVTVDPTNGTTATTASTTATTTTATTATTAGDDSSDTATDGPVDTGGFIEDPDNGHGCGYCDLWAQDCPRGSKCAPYDCGTANTWIATHCVEVDPSAVQVGEVCVVQEHPLSGIDDCEVGAMCWDVDPNSLMGVCVPFCTGSEANPICDDAGATCYGNKDAALILCLPSCNPLASTCASEEECVWNEHGVGAQDFVCLPGALVLAHEYGDDCSVFDACDTGLVCRVGDHVPGCETDACCTVLGDLTTPPDCPDAGQSCLPMYDDGEAPVGYENLCFCGVAA